MNGKAPKSDAVAVVLEIQRLAHGGKPHDPSSPQAVALAAALDALAQDAALAALAALGRKCFDAAVKDLQCPCTVTSRKTGDPAPMHPANPSTERQS